MPQGVYERNPALRPQTFRNCASCGDRFGPLDCLSQKFCSVACKAQSQRGKTSPLRGRRRPNLDRARVGSCLHCGGKYRAVNDHGTRRQIYCSRRCYLANRRVSHFEIEVFDRIVAMGIAVDRSAAIGRWTFDGRLTDTLILVEADGDYWHSSEVVKERDARKDAWCLKVGYELIRVTEHAFREDPEASLNIIVARWEALTGQTAVRNPE